MARKLQATSKGKWVLGAFIGVGVLATGGVVWAMTRKSPDAAQRTLEAVKAAGASPAVLTAMQAAVTANAGKPPVEQANAVRQAAVQAGADEASLAAANAQYQAEVDAMRNAAAQRTPTGEEVTEGSADFVGALPTFGDVQDACNAYTALLKYQDVFASVWNFLYPTDSRADTLIKRELIKTSDYCSVAPGPTTASYQTMLASVDGWKAMLVGAARKDPAAVVAAGNLLDNVRAVAGFGSLGINLTPYQSSYGLGVGLARQRIPASRLGYPSGGIQLPASYTGWQYK